MSTLDRDLVYCDIGQLTHGLRDNAKDISDIWFRLPVRRCKFGQRELLDIRETVLGLQILLREIDKQSALKVVANG
jgi:hypothetical protein